MVFQSAGIFCSQSPTGVLSTAMMTLVSAIKILNWNPTMKVTSIISDLVFILKILLADFHDYNFAV